LRAIKSAASAPVARGRTGEYGDLFEDGVIDPTKVARLALGQGASVRGC
jgi:chaperonin GroEL (HSP60 family)